MAKAQLEIRLLGTPSIEWQGQPWPLKRRQVRALVYFLAANANTMRDKLIGVFWPDLAENKARRSLTRLISTLRHELPNPNLIQTQGTTVAFDAEHVRCDLDQFNALAAADQSEGWVKATDLYRGSFLNGFSLAHNIEFETWHSQQQYVVERRHLSTLARLVAGKRQSGEIDDAIQFAQRYLETDDLAEDIHRNLIELYALRNNRNAALKQFEDCAIILERDLGVDPLPETRAAYEAVLTGRFVKPSLDPVPEWATLPSIDLPLIGREAECIELEQIYARLRKGGVIFLSGAPGIGKSRLMQAFATKQSAVVLTGNSQSDNKTLPYQPLVQALRQALPQHNRWQQLAPVWLSEASRLLPELTTYFPGLPQPIEVEPQQAQAHLFEALTQLFTGLATDSPVLLCLDDIHWADSATLGWLHYLTARLANSNLCIMATYRSLERANLIDWQRTLRRKKLMAKVDLDGLSTRAINTMLDQAFERSTPTSDLAQRIQKATGGNSFFVLETIRELVSTGRFADPSDSLPMPATVRDAILSRIGRLSPLAQQLLEIASVLTPYLTFDLILAAAGRDEMESAERLEELTAQQFLIADDNGFQFHHDLAREAIYNNISRWRRHLLHKRAANIMAKSLSGDESGVAAIIATHFEIASEAEQAAFHYQHAAVLSQRVYANQEAAHYYEKALTISTKSESTPKTLEVQLQLHEGLGRVHRRLAQYDKAKHVYKSMRDIATTLNSPEWLARSWRGITESCGLADEKEWRTLVGE